MSKGSPIITLRLDPETLSKMEEVIDRSMHTRHAGQWTRSEFIKTAILEKLAHIERSNKRKSK